MPTPLTSRFIRYVSSPHAPARTPVLVAMPTITGSDDNIGTTYAVNYTGYWLNNPTSFTYQWANSDQAIQYATASTYTLTTTDIGFPISCWVTASNQWGSFAAVTNYRQWMPTTITGCLLWLNAATGVLTSGSQQAVTQWRDQSGLGNHFGSTTVNNYPFVENLASGGLRTSVRFNRASASFMTCSNFNGYTTTKPDMTIAFAMQWAAAPSTASFGNICAVDDATNWYIRRYADATVALENMLGLDGHATVDYTPDDTTGSLRRYVMNFKSGSNFLTGSTMNNGSMQTGYINNTSNFYRSLSTISPKMLIGAQAVTPTFLNDFRLRMFMLWSNYLTGSVLNTIDAYLSNSMGQASKDMSTYLLPVVSSSVPNITGWDNLVGSVLTANTGSWYYTPTTFSYQWTVSGSAIPFATASTYTITSGVVGYPIGCNIYAKNSVGTTLFATNQMRFQPTDLGQRITLWLYPSTLTTASAGVKEISAWTNAATSTFSGSFVNSTTASRPNTEIINGRLASSNSLGGPKQSLTCSNGMGDFISASEFHIMGTFLPRAVNGNSALTVAYNNAGFFGDTNGYLTLALSSSNDSQDLAWLQFTVYQGAAANGTAVIVPISQSNVFDAMLTGALAYLRVNNQVETTGTIGNGGQMAALGLSQSLRINTAYSAAPAYTGSVQEIVISSKALTSGSERGTLRAYLGNMAGVPVEWNPGMLGNKLTMWLDERGQTGSPVSQWANQSNYTYNLFSPGGNQPTLGDYINGFSAPKGNGSNQYIRATGFYNDAFLGYTGDHIFIVFKPYTVTQNNAYSQNATLWSDGNADRCIELFGTASGYNVRTGYINTSATNTTLTISGVATINTPHIVETRRESGVGLYMRFDGTDAPVTASATNLFRLSGVEPKMMGNAGLAQFYSGSIASVIVCNTSLNATERNLVRNYLTAKYGIPAGKTLLPTQIVISGTVEVSGTLTAVVSAAPATPQPTSYQWWRGSVFGGGGTLTKITFATASTYTPLGLDIGYDITCDVFTSDGATRASASVRTPTPEVYLGTACKVMLDERSLYTNNHLVPQWTNLGNAGGFFTAEGTVQPADTGSINYWKNPRFDGIADQLVASSTLGYFSPALINGGATTRFSWFIVAAADAVPAVSAPPANGTAMFGDSGNNLAAIVANINSTGNAAYIIGWTGAWTYAPASSSAQPITIGVPFLFEAGHDATNIYARVGANAYGTASMGNLSAPSAGNPSVGHGNAYFSGSVASIVACDSVLTTTQINTVRAYLGNKYVVSY